MELNTARVFVKDIDTARHFYSSKLGLPMKADGSQHGYCVFKAGNAELVPVIPITELQAPLRSSDPDTVVPSG